MTEPIWLPVEHVIEINREEVEVTGEDHTLLDRGLLESAIDRPRNQYFYGGEQNIARLAVSLLLAPQQFSSSA